MADEGESNPFVDRMKKLVEDSTDAKRIEHDRSVAELQELNKQRVKELIEKDNQRLEQIEKSEEILLGDALEAMNSITPEMLTKDGHVSFESEAFCYMEGEKTLARLGKFHSDLYATSKHHDYYCNTIENSYLKHTWKEERVESGRTSYKIDLAGNYHYYDAGSDMKPSFSRDGSVTFDHLNKEFPRGILGELKNAVISPNGKTFATHSGSYLNIYSRRTKQRTGKIYIGTEKQEFEYSPDGKSIGLCNDNEYVDIYDAWSLKKHASFPVETRPKSIIFHPSLPIIIASSGRYVSMFDLETKKLKWRIEVSKPVADIAISPDGRNLAIASGRSIHLINAKGGEHGSFHLKDYIQSITFNPFGMHNDEGAGKMFAKVQAYVLEAGLTLESSDMMEFKLGWKRKVDI